LSGEIGAKLGVIGGWKIEGNTLKGGTTKFTTNGYSWEPAKTPILLDAANSAICGGKLMPTDGNRMKLCGSLEICTTNGASVTSKNNYIGATKSGLPTETDADGIGIGISSTGEVKVTEANTSMSYKSMFVSLGASEMRLSTNNGGNNSNPLPIHIEGGKIYLES
jgi:hypothetical protein